MKKLLLTILPMLLHTMSVAASSQIGTTTQGGVSYSLWDDMTASVGDNRRGEFTDLVIPETLTYGGKTYTVTSIGNSAFQMAEIYGSPIVFPSTLRSIGSLAFSDCIGAGLSEITLPPSLTSIGDEAFETNFVNIIKVQRETPPIIPSLAFSSYLKSYAKVYVPKGSLEKYKNVAYGWSTFKNISEVSDEILGWARPVFSCADTEINVNRGESVSVSLNLGNATSYNALQFDMTFPAGLDVTKSGSSYSVSLNPQSADASHSIDVNKLSNGSYRVIIYSTKNAAFKSGTDLIRIGVSAGESFSTGSISLGNAIAVEGGKEVAVPDFSLLCKAVVMAESVTLDKTTLSLKAEESYKLTATVLPEDAADKTVEWSSSDNSVVTVDQEGNVTAVAVGSATVTASCSGLSAVCKVTVAATPATSVILNKTTATLQATNTVQLLATVLPATTTDKTVTWTSSAASVATVSSTGLVTAKSVGSATITARCGSVSATCRVTVVATPATSVSLNKTTATLQATKTVQLSATVLPATTTDKTVTWTSSDASVATVSSTGLVTAKSVGSATITARCGSVSATCVVTVVETPATSVSLNKTTATINVDKTLQLTASVLPSTTTNKTITWTTSDSSVAVVTSSGLVTGKGKGTATITAKCGTVSARCTVTVTNYINSITFDMPSPEVEVGETLQMAVSYSPSAPEKTDFSWTSSDQTVATVDGSGLLSGVSEGNATITVSDAVSGVSASCVVSVVPVLYGDANDNGLVSIDDAVTEVNYIMERDPQPFSFRKADVDFNGRINVADVTGTIRIVLTQTKANVQSRVNALGQNHTADELSIESVALDNHGVASIPVVLTADNGFTALQADIEMPEKLIVESISAGEGLGADHIFDYQRLDGNVTRVIVFSNSLSVLNPGSVVLNLNVRIGNGDINSFSEGDIIITDVLASLPDGKAVAFGDSMAEVSNPYASGVEFTGDDETEVIVVDGDVCIKTSCGDVVRIYDLSGTTVCAFVSSGYDRKTLSKGVYIVSAGDKLLKLIIK